MSTVKPTALALEAALKATGLDVVRPGAKIVDPPALVLGPPRLAWEAYGGDPTSATFAVIVVAPMSEDAMELLWTLVEKVTAAIDDASPDWAVTTADPTVWPAGGSDLPAYEIAVEAAL